MRYKKSVLSIIANVLCLGLLSGCGGYSHDFNSSEEAQKYVLAKLSIGVQGVQTRLKRNVRFESK